jgi:titin
VTQTQEEGFTTQAPVFTCSMRDVQLVEGMPAHFEAKLVPVGDPRLRVEWYKDGRPIQVSIKELPTDQLCLFFLQLLSN